MRRHEVIRRGLEKGQPFYAQAHHSPQISYPAVSAYFTPSFLHLTRGLSFRDTVSSGACFDCRNLSLCRRRSESDQFVMLVWEVGVLAGNLTWAGLDRLAGYLGSRLADSSGNWRGSSLGVCKTAGTPQGSSPSHPLTLAHLQRLHRQHPHFPILISVPS